MRRDFANRQELIAYVKEQFPESLVHGDQVSATRGGRTAAVALLNRVNPDRYARSRNFLSGAVTRLAPYLRHGVLSLGEVRRRALTQPNPTKLVNEYAWRDYWRRVYGQIGAGVWEDREPAKREWRTKAETAELPADVATATTGLACMDGFVSELKTTGYLHNHARMWFAAYVIHWRRVRWQSAARFFLIHLLDGDPASNNLSFQWVASTFGSKPYLFNRENLEKYTDGVYCKSCSRKTDCPFAKSYEELDQELFR
jgi:deoxyribodipyrimidine photo-lyase